MARMLALLLSLQVVLLGGLRVADGAVHEAARWLRSQTERRVYAAYEPLFPVPAVEDGYIPQGLCCLEAEDCYVLSAYHAKRASVLAFVSAGSGRQIKRLHLAAADGTAFTGHVGGVASDGVWLYLADGSGVQRLALSALAAAQDGGTVLLTERMETDVRCSYLGCDGVYLYAGEFYNFTTDGAYDTDASHWAAVSLTERHYARCNAYALAGLDAAFAGQTAAPAFALTVPDKVQGIARLPDGGFALSTSYGRNNNSFLLTFRDVTAQPAAETLAYGETAAPLYHLDRGAQTAKTELPPLLEGITVAQGQVVGVFESCAQKYADGAFPVEAVCRF